MNSSTTYVLNTTICVSEANCSSNCLSCTSPDHCLACDTGSVLMLDEGSMACGSGCGIDKCSMCANASCLICESPFQVGLDNSVCGCPPGNDSCPCAVEYCGLCSSSNKSDCLQCLPTFRYNATTEVCECPPTFILQTDSQSGTPQCVCP